MEASPRGRLLAFAPALHLLLRALWVAGVLNIAKDVVHCARLQSTTSVLDDHRCNLSLSFALAMLFISLLGRSILRRSDAKAEAELGGGEEDGDDVLPEKASSSPETHPRAHWMLQEWSPRDVEVGFVMGLAFLPYLWITMLVSFFLLVPRLHPPPPAERGVPVVELLGDLMVHVGCLCVSINLCSLGVPYAMLRLRKALDAKDGDAWIL
uniref:Uncharacterized protein n=1 Tax=Oryza meridionalis TaxID=40149 RepID=A0A0E0ELI6_9ORYZ